MNDNMPGLKSISFLATGNEIIEGEVQDTNGQYFATTLHDKGARIYQHVHVSDDKNEIATALNYLLAHSDVVITTGGLGPTSDDNTRFAIAQVTGRALQFDEPSWEKIKARLASFHLNIVDSNRQQALMPQGCEIYPNANGSAPGCHVEWNGKHIFMLPGPPKECRPIFDDKVMNALESLQFFDKKERYQWTTIGLSEGEIAETIDAMAKPFGFETGYRWSYPYLIIKVIAKDHQPDKQAIAKIDTLLSSFCVSRERKNAFDILDELLNQVSGCIYIVDDIHSELSSPLVVHPNIISIEKSRIPKVGSVFVVESTPKISNEIVKPGSMTLTSKGYSNGQQIYEHQLTVPVRGKDIIHAAKAYTAWQLGKFICESIF